jgi:hypothetical protein
MFGFSGCIPYNIRVKGVKVNIKSGQGYGEG